jgi:16S rRNA G527 N7-methylase RsmG
MSARSCIRALMGISEVREACFQVKRTRGSRCLFSQSKGSFLADLEQCERLATRIVRIVDFTCRALMTVCSHALV